MRHTIPTLLIVLPALAVAALVHFALRAPAEMLAQVANILSQFGG